MALFWAVIMIFGGYHIFVESTVQGTELIDIEFYTRYFTDQRFRFTVPRK